MRYNELHINVNERFNTKYYTLKYSATIYLNNITFVKNVRNDLTKAHQHNVTHSRYQIDQCEKLSSAEFVKELCFLYILKQAYLGCNKAIQFIKLLFETSTSILFQINIVTPKELYILPNK